MKNMFMRKTLNLFSVLILFLFFLHSPSFAQNQETVNTISELEELEDRNLEYLKQIHRIVKDYPSFSYNYTIEDGEVKDVKVTGVDDQVDRKRLEVAIFDLKSNKNRMKTKQNRIGVFYSVDKEAEYAGESDLNRVILDNLEYPQDAKDWGVEGTVYVKFVVDEKGEIPFATTSSNIETTMEPYVEDLERQAVEAVKATSGDWEPGTVNGVEVSSLAVVPVTFEFEKHPSIPVLIQ